MSRASKITLALSTILSVSTIYGVYYMAEYEKDALQDGPIKDAKRLQKRAFNSNQKANLADFEAQKALKEKLEQQQPLTGEIIEGIDEKKQ